MSSRRTSSIPKEDVVFPRMLNCDSRCSQMLPSLSPAIPGALLCNETHCLGDGKRVILRQRVRGSVRAVRAVRNTQVFQMETGVVADVLLWEYGTKFSTNIAQMAQLLSKFPTDRLLLFSHIVFAQFRVWQFFDSSPILYSVTLTCPPSPPLS